jgi:hypothetical protein
MLCISQRSLSALMYHYNCIDMIHICQCLLCAPAGSERHYTHSYSTFLGKLQAEPDFATWLQPIEADLAALLTGPSWMGEPAARTHR